MKSVILIISLLFLCNITYANFNADTIIIDTNKNTVVKPSQATIQNTNTTPAKVPQKIITPLELSGPRVGFTLIGSGETADNLRDNFNASPFVTQFGWQFEKQYFALENGTAGLVEFVGLIAGLEQGLFLPSANMLVGVRSSNGAEFAFGPNISVSGAAFALAVGHTFRSGSLNFPVNFAVVPSSKGVRFSLLFGFNAQTR
jgi:hypothetical protein